MLLTEERFKDFITQKICDTSSRRRPSSRWRSTAVWEVFSMDERALDR